MTFVYYQSRKQELLDELAECEAFTDSLLAIRGRLVRRMETAVYVNDGFQDAINGIDDLSGSAGEPRFEMWRACLFAALGILMAEQCLGWWWGRRK